MSQDEERQGWKQPTPYLGVAKKTIAARCVKMVMASFRKDQFADAEAFVEMLLVTFMQWPESVITNVCDPRRARSIQQRFKFPPALAEVSEICGEEADVQRKEAEAARRPKLDPNRNRDYRPSPNTPGCFAKILVSPQAPQYGAVQAYAESPAADPRMWKRDEHGLWVANLIFQSDVRAPLKWQSPSHGALAESLGRLSKIRRASAAAEDDLVF